MRSGFVVAHECEHLNPSLFNYARIFTNSENCTEFFCSQRSYQKKTKLLSARMPAMPAMPANPSPIFRVSPHTHGAGRPAPLRDLRVTKTNFIRLRTLVDHACERRVGVITHRLAANIPKHVSGEPLQRTSPKARPPAARATTVLVPP